MIQATAKADSLPPELRKHWENSMAEKFPPDVNEGFAYVKKHYPDLNCWVNGNKLDVEVIVEKQVAQSTMAIDPQMYAQLMNYTTTSATQFQGVNSNFRTVQSIERITLTDFRPSHINRKLKEYKS